MLQISEGNYSVKTIAVGWMFVHHWNSYAEKEILF